MPDNEGGTEAQDQAVNDPATGGDPAEDLDPFAGIGDESTDDPPPLEQGGQRFNQVWARMKKAESATEDARTANSRLMERVRSLEASAQPIRRETTQITEVTANDLKVAVDSGDSAEIARITVALGQQAAQKETRKQAKKSNTNAQYSNQLNRARLEIAQYIDIAPSIGTKDHPRWKEVENAFVDDTMNLGSPSDARAELRALRTVFGPVQRFKARVEATRKQPDHHIEVGAGGSNFTPQQPQQIAPTNNNPFDNTNKQQITDLKQIPLRYTQHWDARGMSQEDQLKEANYLRPSQLARK